MVVRPRRGRFRVQRTVTRRDAGAGQLLRSAPGHDPGLTRLEPELDSKPESKSKLKPDSEPMQARASCVVFLRRLREDLGQTCLDMLHVVLRKQDVPSLLESVAQEMPIQCDAGYVLPWLPRWGSAGL